MTKGIFFRIRISIILWVLFAVMNRQVRIIYNYNHLGKIVWKYQVRITDWKVSYNFILLKSKSLSLPLTDGVTSPSIFMSEWWLSIPFNSFLYEARCFETSFMSASSGRYLNFMHFKFGQNRIRYFSCLGEILFVASNISKCRYPGIDLGPTDLEW